ncbi:MAG: ATP-binding protein [Coriobacteriales bacterium]|jgi:hypothetical protein
MPEDSLADFITSVSGDDQLAIEENLGDGFVKLRIAEAERRQAKHDIRSVEDIVIEMLRNARDAHARHIYIAISRAGQKKTLVFLDDGDGIPEHMHEAIFEPRVTSKLESMVMDRWGVHGRGMALYSIKSNTESAVVLSSGEELGSSFQVVADLDELSEKADQSTYPTLYRDDDDVLQVGRGPHNVIRTAVEFALASKDRVSVYLGSPTDILAELVRSGRKRLSDEQLLFCDDMSTLPVCLRPAAAGDALELVDIAESIGLGVSERTAHRIMAGQIDPCPLLLTQVMPERKTRIKNAPVDILRDSRGLKIAKEDEERFSRSLETAFQTIAERYYLELADKPKIRVGKDAITVKFPIEKQ